ncbi:MAG: GGDEF domain-containing protein [Robiginitomaculum sp.]
MIDPRVSDMLDLQTATLRGLGESMAQGGELEALEAENKALKMQILELERAADTDPLLPLYNRRAFMREINRARNVMGRYDIQSSIIYIDLDGFKTVNDRYGHAIGDEILRSVGTVLQSGVRDCDLVARLGGDEFGVLLFKTDEAIAKAKASVLSCRIAEQKITFPTGEISITASWGIATCESEETADQILARADRAMYIAKKRKAARASAAA